MATESPLRLLDLSFVVKEIVINEMKLMTLFYLAQCSQKSRQTVKSVFHSKRYNATLFINNHPVLIVYEGNDTYSQNRAVFHIEKENPRQKRRQRNAPQTVSDWRLPKKVNDQKELHTHWNKQHRGIQRITEEVLDVFSLPFFYAEFNLNRRCGSDKDILITLNSFSGMVKELRVTGHRISQLQYEYVLNNAEFTKQAHFAVQPFPSFYMPNLEVYFDHVKFEFCDWITLDNIMNMNCITIELDDLVVVRDDEVNTLIKRIIAGEKPEVECILMNYKARLDKYKILKDISVTDREGSGEVEKIHLLEILDANGKDFKLNDGSTGSVYFVEYNEGEKVCEQVQIVVWRNN